MTPIRARSRIPINIGFMISKIRSRKMRESVSPVSAVGSMDDPAGTLQYGLVAEEVEKLYPELVTHAAGGQVQSVRYSMLYDSAAANVSVTDPVPPLHVAAPNTAPGRAH